MIIRFYNFGLNLQSGITVCRTEALTDESTLWKIKEVTMPYTPKTLTSFLSY